MITRRGWLAAGAALAGAPALAQPSRPTFVPGPPGRPFPASAPAPDFAIESRPSGRVDYGPALTALRAYALTELRAVGLPGMTLCVVTDDGLRAFLPLGWADIENRVPVTSGHLFQIGSISKSFVALTLLALADQGKVDLDTPASRYLPDAPWPAEPVTLAQILSHRSGLPDDAPLFPRTPDGRLWCGFPPGSAFSYSNTGYNLLGHMLEHVAGAPRPEVVRRLVAGRLGEAGRIEMVIAPPWRNAPAVCYWPRNRWAAEVPRIPLEPAMWDPEDMAAGSVTADARAMAAYLELLMRLGRGDGAGVVSATAARRFATSAGPTKGDFGPGAGYGLGVAVVPVDGAPCLHHTGGMMSFSSSHHVDPASGVGCFASVNARDGAYRPSLTTAYAIRLLRAAKAGQPLPPPPDPLAPWVVKTPEALAGEWLGQGRGFELVAQGGRLALRAGSGVAPVFGGGAPDRLLTTDPAFAPFGFDVERQGGVIQRLWWGGEAFQRAGGPAPPAPDSALAPLAGVYLNRDPWVGAAEVHVRGDRLWAEGAGPLANRGAYWTLAKDVGGVERFRFDAPLNGRTTRLNASGNDLLRIEAPLLPATRGLADSCVSACSPDRAAGEGFGG